MSDINKHLVLRKYRAGSLLFREGDLTSSFFVIHKGEVEIFTLKNGIKRVLGKASPGEAIGEFAFILKSPRTASAEAKTDLEAFEISEDGYQELLSALPDWAQSFIHNLVKRFLDSRPN